MQFGRNRFNAEQTLFTKNKLFTRAFVNTKHTSIVFTAITIHITIFTKNVFAFEAIGAAIFAGVACAFLALPQILSARNAKELAADVAVILVKVFRAFIAKNISAVFAVNSAFFAKQLGAIFTRVKAIIANFQIAFSALNNAFITSCLVAVETRLKVFNCFAAAARAFEANAAKPRALSTG